MKYNDELRERVARAICADAGFLFSGQSLLEEAAAGNPRVGAWVRTADAVLAVTHPRNPRAARAQ